MTVLLPRREAIEKLLASYGKPMRFREIATQLRVDPDGIAGFQRLLEGLAQQGVVRALTGNRFAVLKDTSLVQDDRREGVFFAHPRGFGFVRSAGHDDDLYIHDSDTLGALHGDTVLAQWVSRSRLGSEGRVLRVLLRKNERVAGTLRRKGKSTWVEPDDERIRGPVRLQGELRGRDGEAVIVHVTRFPRFADENPEGELAAVLGPPGEPRVEIEKILAVEGVESNHTPAAQAEAEAFGSQVSPDALTDREDLTHLPLLTIDPHDARDHDDAVWVERTTDGGFRAWIAIADVSHYVRPGTALDTDAGARGCSIYLPTRAIPMLPAALSSDLCSLVPRERRLCLCAVVTLDAQGSPQTFRVVRGVMSSRAKLTYEAVALALGWTKATAASPSESDDPTTAERFLPDLRTADVLAQLLRARRIKRGAIDLQIPEARVVVDETGDPTDIERRGKDPGVARAYALIEELMLLANESVAAYLTERAIPTIYRVHPPPDEKKLDQFAVLCADRGIPLELDTISKPGVLADLATRLRELPGGDVLQSVLLRAMKRASYDVKNVGHFGLAASHYLHFTSPIRRYPDLVVHRILTHLLTADGATDNLPTEETLREAAMVASERERRAMNVERHIVDLYRALYMRKHIGDTFEGIISSVTDQGITVLLHTPFVEVYVNPDALGRDTYEFQPETMTFLGRRSGDAVGLGEEITVTIETVSILRRTIHAWRHAPGMLSSRGALRYSPFARGGTDAPKKDRRPPAPTPRSHQRLRPSSQPRRGPKKGGGRKKLWGLRRGRILSSMR